MAVNGFLAEVSVDWWPFTLVLKNCLPPGNRDHRQAEFASGICFKNVANAPHAHSCPSSRGHCSDLRKIILELGERCRIRRAGFDSILIGETDVQQN